MGIQETDPLTQLSLPPGFRFYPTDEELMVQYLLRKVAGHQFSLQIIGEIDLYKHDPWVLPSKALFGEKEWYFFSPRDRKYPNGSRPNRVAGSGYWKATGTDKIISFEGRKVGIKKALVFYVGKAPKGTKTNWIMHEYRLLDSSRRHGNPKLDDWVLCRIYKKGSSCSAQKSMPSTSISNSSKENSYNGSLSPSSNPHLEDVFDSLPEIDDRLLNLAQTNSLNLPIQYEEKINLNNLGSANFDWATLAGLNSASEFRPTQGHIQSHQGIVNYQNTNVNNTNVNDVYIPSLPETMIAESMEKSAVQNGVSTTTRQAGLQQNSSMFMQSFSNSVDPYRFNSGF